MAKPRLTKAQLKAEVLKCGKDPVYFIKNYCKISHPLKGKIPFHTYDYQDDLLKDFDTFQNIVVLKARQLGISTIVAAYIVWLMLFHRDKNVLVLATKRETSANLVRKVKAMMKALPKYIQIAQITTDNRNSFELSNGSQIKPSAKAEDAGRSEALSLLVIDEAAHVDGLADVWPAIGPTLATGGRCIALSTPNGVGNWFHQTYIEAENQDNDFHPVKLNWDVHPERDAEWLEKEKRKFSPRDFAQEYLCNFNMSGDTVIDPKDIMRLRTIQKEPELRVGFDRNYWIWEQPIVGFNYLLVSDVARGDSADYSAFMIFKVETMELVAEYKGKVPIEHFAEMLYTAGREYFDAMLVVENNSYGYNALEKLINKEYPNLYYSVKSTHEYVEPVYAENRSGVVPGFTTSLKTRPIIIAKMEEFVRNKLVTTYSKRLLDELDTFIWNHQRPEAQKGCNDDLTMCFTIACWIADTVLAINGKNTEYQKVMLKSAVLTRTSFDTKMPGMIGYNKKRDPFSEDPLVTAKKMHQQYKWLYKG